MKRLIPTNNRSVQIWLDAGIKNLAVLSYPNFKDTVVSVTVYQRTSCLLILSCILLKEFDDIESIGNNTKLAGR